MIASHPLVLLRYAPLLLAGVAFLLMTSLVNIGQAQVARQKEFRDLYDIARHLETNGMQVTKDSDADFLDKRRKLVFAFARESKSALAYTFYQQMTRLINEYRTKAEQYIEESAKKSNGNWLMKINPFNNALGSLKGLSRNDADLTAMTQRYESLVKLGQLDKEMIAKDLAQYQLRVVDMILFALATELRYLMVEDAQLLNVAIYQKLKGDKFVSDNNFFSIDTLNDEQKRDLIELFRDQVNVDLVDVATAIEHILDPGNLIIGRFFETCSALQNYRDEWEVVLKQCGQDCTVELIPAEKRYEDSYERVVRFCDTFIGHL